MLAQMDASKSKQAEYEAWLQQAKLREESKEAGEKAARLAKFIADQKQMEAGRPSLEPEGKRRAVAAYWLPSEAPALDASLKAVEKPDKKIYCLHGTEKHTVSLKKLAPVQFQLLPGQEPRRPGCPACHKAFKNGMEMVAVTPCGHIFCQECAPTGKEPSCLVCETPVEGSVSLSKEGTGFAAAGGTVELVKYDVAFQ